MELEQLRVFLAIAELGSFRRAAAALYISHSTVSRCVQALEASLGVRLFERAGRAARLTKAGELLHREGAQLLQSADALCEIMRNPDLASEQ